MALAVDSVQPSTELPRQADVVVIGGGIIGTSTAFFLRRKGLSVALCEKDTIAAEQSSRNWVGAASWAATHARFRSLRKACGSGGVSAR